MYGHEQDRRKHLYDDILFQVGCILYGEALCVIVEVSKNILAFA